MGDYLVDCGGEKSFLNGWYVTIEARKEGKTQGTSDMYYFSEKNKKFRSRAEVARYFNLAAAPPKRAGIGSKKRRPTYELERRRLQKEIDKLNSTKSKIESKLTELIDEKEGKVRRRRGEWLCAPISFLKPIRPRIPPNPTTPGKGHRGS